MIKYNIHPQSAITVEVEQGSVIQIIDVEGKQVADFVAYNHDNILEKLSTKATIDNNGSLFLSEGQTIFSNHYEALLTLTKSPVPKHDLIFPACSPAMYKSQYEISKHPSCAQNLQAILTKHNLGELPDPVNFFMNTLVQSDGTIQINEPLTQPGDFIELKAEKNLIVAVAACSVSQSECNGFKCTGLQMRKL